MFSRFSLFNEPIFRELDRLMPRALTSFGGPGDGAAASGGYCPVNVAQDQDYYYIQALVPGLPADQLELSWQGNALTIRGEVAAQMPKGAVPVWSEIQPYQFHRTVLLGDDIDAEHVEAQLENGVLTIVAPKAEHAKARRIPIGGGSATQKQITDR